MSPAPGGVAAPGGRVAIVTGAASGIGEALARELAGRGVEVVLADRQLDVAEGVASGIRRQGGLASAEALDVRDFERFRALAQRTVERRRRIDFLFNNAGIGIHAEMKDYDPADWDDVFDVNLRGVAYGVQAVYPLMVQQGFGHIVNTASMAGLAAMAYGGSYTASKHAVVGLSRALRIEARSYGVRVSVVCPGVIRTPLLEGGHYGRLKYPLDMDRMHATWNRLRPMDPTSFAERVLRAVERNRAIIVVPAWWKGFWYLDRVSPWLGERIQLALFRRMKQEVEAIRLDRSPPA